MSETRPTPSTPPDLESLAAYVDGRLTGLRKAAVEERLVRDDDYYEVFLEILDFQAEEASRRRAFSPTLLPERKIARRRLRFAAPLAAAALLALVVGIWGGGGAAGPEAWTLPLNPSSVVAGEVGWSRVGWSQSRSSGMPSHLRLDEIAFRLGVRAVDLRTAVDGGDPLAALPLAAELQGLSAATELDAARQAFEDLRKVLDGGDADAVQGRLDRAEKKLTRAIPDAATAAFEFGGWLEASRLAALAQDAAALRKLLDMAPDADAARRVLEVGGGDRPSAALRVLEAMLVERGG